MGIHDRFKDKNAAAAALPGPVNVSRRRFMQGVGGLAVGVYLGGVAACKPGDKAATAPSEFAPNAFLRIGSDDSVTVIAKHIEMGQGTYTGLATLAAEELDAAWSQVRVEGAPADKGRYGNSLMGGIQGTGGSNAMANSHEQMRRAGASARAMLVSAAAERWKVPAAEITVSEGVLSHAASGKTARFGELAEAAAKLPVPEQVTLKAPKDFKLIGRQQLRRPDSNGKTDGSAVFTQDIRLPDMLVAVVAHPPRFGARLKSYDATAAKAVAGVVDVVAFKATQPGMRDGVAVLAKNTWIAKQGRDALTLEWDDATGIKSSSSDLLTQFRELSGKTGTVARKSGDAAAALAKAPAKYKIVDAEYQFPHLAHASMEPLNCVVQVGEGRCEIWNGEQFQTFDQGAVASLLKIAPEQVTIHQLYAGGSFGRRANPLSDYVVEAAAIAKAAYDQGHKVPVKMVWLREEDTRAGFYRPMFLHKLSAAVDADGGIAAWQQRIVGESIMKGTAFEAFAIKDGIDNASVEGSLEIYPAANVQIELHSPDTGVPVQWWRSVGHTHTAFVTETMLDELAHAAKRDPFEYRRGMLSEHPRHRGTLELVAEKAGWSKPLAAGAKGERRGRGIAVHESFNTVVAEVAEVTIKPDGSLRVDRVVCAVDCGLAINPDVIRAQMEGGIGFALTAALHSAITLEGGAPQQTNFHQYLPLRMNEMPKVEVHIVPSAANPTGVGEPGVPPLAPALANAIFAATGKRLRKLPLGTQIA